MSQQYKPNNIHMKLREDRDYLDTAQLIITIVTAAFALKINYVQGQLSARIQREGITQTYAEKILNHLNDLEMDRKQKGAVVIDVLDIITEANLNVSERPYTDSQRQQLIPLRLALATNDVDSITNIGTGKGKRELWTKMAIQSGNDEIKRTAIRALAQIGRYRGSLAPSVAELETFRFCVENILEISDNFARTPLTQEAIENFSIILGVTQKFPILLEDDQLQALMQRGHKALVVVESTAIKDRAEKQQAASPDTTPTPSPGSKPTSQSQAGRQGENSFQPVLYTGYAANDSTLSIDSMAPTVGSSRPILVASSILNATQKALKQMNDLNLKKTVITRATTEAEKTVSDKNIEALKSDDVEIRRKARDDLAAGGAANVPLLLEALRKEPNNYRIKLGVSFTLFKITEAVSITNSADAALLVRLIGDSEPEVRQYASEFLMRLADPDSVNAVYPELQKAIDQAQAVPQPNENAVFNAVVVLGTWMRTLPDGLAANKKAIADYLDNLASNLPRDKWGKTLAVIKELNAPR